MRSGVDLFVHLQSLERVHRGAAGLKKSDRVVPFAVCARCDLDVDGGIGHEHPGAGVGETARVQDSVRWRGAVLLSEQSGSPRTSSFSFSDMAVYRLMEF